jgi:hypothetical protein
VLVKFAFDYVNHDTTLATLHFYGIQQQLQIRSHPTLLKGKDKLKQNHLIILRVFFFLSDWGTTKHSIPSGSVLEILFLINT